MKGSKYINGYPFHAIVLKDGRLALGLENKGIAILDSESVNQLFLIKMQCIHYIELKNGNIAAVTLDNKIIIIKIEQENYQILQIIDIASFNILSQLWDRTLIGCAEGEIIFFEEKNNLYSKNFGIKIKNSSKFVFQTKKGEI